MSTSFAKWTSYTIDPIYRGPAFEAGIKTVQYLFNSALENYKAIKNKEMPIKKQIATKRFIENTVIFNIRTRIFETKEELFQFTGTIDYDQECIFPFAYGITDFTTPENKKEYDQYCKEMEADNEGKTT